jgi:hypothetical protein
MIATSLRCAGFCVEDILHPFPVADACIHRLNVGVLRKYITKRSSTFRQQAGSTGRLTTPLNANVICPVLAV